EFKNLQRAHKAGVAVPVPLDVKKNVLVMEFVGEEEVAYPRMKDRPPEDPRAMFDKLFGFVKVLYNKAELVHSDLSEYNVLVTPEPVLIDFSMATDITNPMADEWLRRDLRNLASYFRKLGVDTPEPEQMFQEVKGE
ncbi:MAG: RIO1 family regulatory kinase/ATPase, partial [Candidatus Hadarchaeota archaeon]|nr:RIO1 family regulatory kinase/ATPase [Candidatus Hadarchaeota archaeon]